MQTNVQIIFYSMFGHVFKMAEAVAEGAREVEGTSVSLFQVPELESEERLRRSGAWEAQQEFADIPIATVEQLTNADAIIFGTPTRFGNMAGQMRHFLNQTTRHWLNGTLVGKVGSVFTSTGSQHGGQETTITSFHLTLLHHGMIIVGAPYIESRLLNMDEITGGTPYGATTMAGIDGSRQPTENELAIARFQGRHVAQIAAKLTGAAMPELMESGI